MAKDASVCRTEARIIPRTRVVTMLACGVLLVRSVNAILLKELIELLVERMAGRWRELLGSDEKRFRSRLAFGQSHAESSSANVARENSARRKILQRSANPPLNTREGIRQRARNGGNARPRPQVHSLLPGSVGIGKRL